MSNGVQLFPINSFPPPRLIYQLVGKSNFQLWLSAIKPYLFSSTQSTGLLLGGWVEPAGEYDAGQYERKAWQAANDETCRFIRGTLAMNVIPYVRQHTTAKGLWENLLWLYGEDAGIDIQGGPALPLDESRGPLCRRSRFLAALSKEKAVVVRDTAYNATSFPHSQSKNDVILDTAAKPDLSPPPDLVPEERVDSGSTQMLEEAKAQVTPVTAPKAEPSQFRFKDGMGDEVHVPRIHIHERVRISPDPSLETIDEEPHPGRRVDLGDAVVLTRRHTNLSFHKPEDGTAEVGVALTQDYQHVEASDSGGENHEEKQASKYFFQRMLKRGSKDYKGRDKLSLSLPLRRLDIGFKEKGSA